MAYYPPEVIQKIKELDLLTYLQNFNPDELVHNGKNNYCTKTHDSLKISNGMWFWFSRGFGGKSALDYLIRVKEYTFMQAVEDILEKTEQQPIKVEKFIEKEIISKLILPKKFGNCKKVKQYLLNRGIDIEIIEDCIDKGYIYEQFPNNNVVFVGYDSNQKARYAAIRATNTTRYMQEAGGSDKTYSFRLIGDENNESVHLFESAIDTLSYATLVKMLGKDWKKENLVSFAGVYQPAKNVEESKVPKVLQHYLKQYQNTKKIFIHFDNDCAGRNATLALKTILPQRYQVFDAPPPYGKDYNDFLCEKIRTKQQKERER